MFFNLKTWLRNRSDEHQGAELAPVKRQCRVDFFGGYSTTLACKIWVLFIFEKYFSCLSINPDPVKNGLPYLCDRGDGEGGGTHRA